MQVPAPVQSPDQPVKVEPTEAAAVNVTGTAAKGAEQVEPQSMPAGLEVTVPEPVPVLATVSVLPRTRATAKSRSGAMVEPLFTSPTTTIFPSGWSAIACPTWEVDPNEMVTKPPDPKVGSSDPSAL